MTRPGGSQARTTHPPLLQTPAALAVQGTTAMAYCCRCGVYAALEPDTKMCWCCRRDWRPSAPVTADLGTRRPGAP